MPSMTSPLLPLPAPLRALETPSFTHYSVTVRLPEIARRTLAENDFPPSVVAAIQALLQGIPAEKIRPLDLPLAPDREAWECYVSPYQGMNWLEVPWFFAEAYFYERILEATGYFHAGPGRGVDPFVHQKRLGLETSSPAIQRLANSLKPVRVDDRHHPAGLEWLLRLDLKGNQNDLSLWPASRDRVDREEGQASLSAGRILVDRIPEIAHLLAKPAQSEDRVDLVVDNAGFELVCDLALGDVLLSLELASQVRLHLKDRPVFVSDAMAKDVRDSVSGLVEIGDEEVAAFARRLEGHLETGRLELAENPFWTSPLAQWEMPSELRGELAQARLLIFKGDALYRRLLGDRHWGFTDPLDLILAYLPAPTAALRTLKSEIVAGLTLQQVAAAAKEDPTWMSDGKWAVAQLVSPAVES